MDRRQRHLLAGAILCRALLLVCVLPGTGHLWAAEPLPSLSPPPDLPAPTPRLPPPAEARPRTSLLGGNPRPWEWRSWNGENHQNKEAPRKPAAPGPGGPEKGGQEAEDSAAVQRIIEQLPPDERAVFTRNLKRWSQLTIEEQQTLRRQATERRQRMVQEMEGALRESGLHLDDDRREVFMLRYGQERRKLERELQAKIAAERARRTPEIVERLKKEFGSAPVPSPSPSPAPTMAAPVPSASPQP